MTAIYNVELPVLEEALGRAFDRLGLPWLRVGDRILIGEPGANVPGDAKGAGLAPPNREALAIDSFPALRHVTLRWRVGGDPVRSDVVAELAKELREAETPDNPVSGWMLTVSGCLFAAVIFISLALIAIIVLLRRNHRRNQPHKSTQNLHFKIPKRLRQN